MKRNELLKYLRGQGCELLREGSSHSWWWNPEQNKRSAIRLGTKGWTPFIVNGLAYGGSHGCVLTTATTFVPLKVPSQDEFGFGGGQHIANPT